MPMMLPLASSPDDVINEQILGNDDISLETEHLCDVRDPAGTVP
jgi:hypothetical protein